MNQGGFQETIPGPNPWTFHARSHQCPFPSHSVPKELICLSASHGRGATRGSPPPGPCSSPTVPRGCCGAMHGRTPGTKIELRTELVFAQNCPRPVPPPAPQPITTPHRSQPLSKTAVGPGRGCSSHRASVETMGLRGTWGPSLGAGGPPASSHRGKDQLVPRHKSNAMLQGAQPRLSAGTATASWSQGSQPW